MNSLADIVAIIPAAGRPTNQILLHTNLPDTMLPINGRPVIGYILENLLERGISRSVIALHADDTVTEEYVIKKFGSKLSLTIVRDKHYGRGLGHTIQQSVAGVAPTDKVLIYLGDTVYHGPLSFDEDFVVVSEDYEQPSQWCFIETDGTSQCYVNKPKTYSGTGSVLVGIYFFTDSNALQNSVNTVDGQSDFHELHQTLDAYPKQFNTIPAVGWYDCGNIENYYRAKVDFLKIRSFNQLTYNDLYGTITKSSQKTQKIIDEINWYKNMPAELKVFSPRLVSDEIGQNLASYTLEYYGYQSLADYFIFNHFDDRVWKIIIDRLFEILGVFKKHTAELPATVFSQVYEQKTLDRIAEMTADPIWRKRFAAPEITVNGVTYPGWPTYAAKLSEIVQSLNKKSATTFLHGDFHPGNILFDPHSRIFKFIDPRGSFGVPSIHGDHNYDIAKLRHSFCGRYDFIMGDLFDSTVQGNEYSYVTHHEREHERIAAYFDTSLKRYGYDLDTIKTIEALLFISMIPLHGDAPKRQLAMFVTGIQLLNEITL